MASPCPSRSKEIRSTLHNASVDSRRGFSTHGMSKWKPAAGRGNGHRDFHQIWAVAPSSTWGLNWGEHHQKNLELPIRPEREREINKHTPLSTPLFGFVGFPRKQAVAVAWSDSLAVQGERLRRHHVHDVLTQRDHDGHLGKVYRISEHTRDLPTTQHAWRLWASISNETAECFTQLKDPIGHHLGPVLLNTIRSMRHCSHSPTALHVLNTYASGRQIQVKSTVFVRTSG